LRIKRRNTSSRELITSNKCSAVCLSTSFPPLRHIRTLKQQANKQTHKHNHHIRLSLSLLLKVLILLLLGFGWNLHDDADDDFNIIRKNGLEDIVSRKVISQISIALPCTA
jgi:hypothetical protein